MSYTSKGCITVLPFLAANGKPVCCVVIFQSKQSSPNFEWAHGTNVEKQPVRNEFGEIIQMENIVPGKYHPGGLTCCFNGKTIDFLTISSKSDDITAEIPVDILKYFDRTKIFPQIPGDPIPFLLVDGHNI